MCLSSRTDGWIDKEASRAGRHVTRKGRKKGFFFVFLKGVQEWSGATSRGSGGKGSCDRKPEAKTRRGVLGGGAVSALSYYFHFPFPELSAALRS